MKHYIVFLLAFLLVGCAAKLKPYDGSFAERGLQDKVVILGQVRNPTMVEPGTSMLDALIQAKGLTMAATEKNTWYWCPGAEPVRIDLHSLKRGDMTQNAILRSGCVITVPKTLRSEISSWFGMFRGAGDVFYILDKE